ncbi:hypothetical protein [Okibacterium fritillariae]|uniref:hypothetical protein n=1 Tax=Okibacterium fritillariae TaxID=123320 RepID=UPI0009A7528A|nr:hypothetical protein [Okibacterium fritillariae]
MPTTSSETTPTMPSALAEIITDTHHEGVQRHDEDEAGCAHEVDGVVATTGCRAIGRADIGVQCCFEAHVSTL